MTDSKRIFLSVFIMIGAVIIFTAPLLHIRFPKKPAYQQKFENKIKKYHVDKDNELCDLKEALSQNKISPLDYIQQLEEFQINKAVKTDILDYQLNNLIDENRIAGFRSMRIFLIGFGIRLPYILFSFIILFFCLYSKEKLKTNVYLHRAVIVLYTISFFISFYLTIWFLLPRDLPITAYHLLIGCLSILSTTLSIYFIKYYYNRGSNFLLKFKVKELVRFINKSRSYTLDFALKASQANPDLKKDIKNKIGKYDEELEETMLKVANKKESEIS
ncbi:hypothetical protein [Aquimarina megaterium]|uniref:hypothetical protein n=1 Tax=Aquimarina megaterium TaxID=1443666 RepID=UPI00046E9D29|nr:hypothetical protein [Aquimarina megaterium]